MTYEYWMRTISQKGKNYDVGTRIIAVIEQLVKSYACSLNKKNWLDIRAWKADYECG